MSAIYFTAPDGTRYRVLDTAWKDGKTIAANPPAAWATTRAFRAKDGTRRFSPLAYLDGTRWVRCGEPTTTHESAGMTVSVPYVPSGKYSVRPSDVRNLY